MALVACPGEGERRGKKKIPILGLRQGMRSQKGQQVTMEYTFQKLRFRRRAKVGERTKGKEGKNGNLES